VTISNAEMRQRVLDELKQRSEAAGDWRQAIGVEGNQRLLSLIATLRPSSVAELSQHAERAQPNVSRSLAALVKAGLVELRSNGRTSVPTLTALAEEKIAALELASAPADALVGNEEDLQPQLFQVEFDQANADQLNGTVWVTLRLRSQEPIAMRRDGDVEQLCTRLAADWWRILYRRDTPYRMCQAVVTAHHRRGSVTLLTQSLGRRVELSARHNDGPVALDRDTAVLGLANFQASLRTQLLSPVAQTLAKAGRSNNAIADHLGRLDDISMDSASLAFFATAGALGVNPNSLSAEMADQVRELIREVPEEDARLDLASAVLGDFSAGVQWIRSELHDKAGHNRLAELAKVRQSCIMSESGLEGLKPYERGLELARRARRHLKLDPDRPVGGLRGLANLFGAPDFVVGDDAPAALLAYQGWDQDAPIVVSSGAERRRSTFVLARAIGDHLAFGDHHACVADLYTDRQAVGRAFAAEFLAPAQAVVAMIEEEDASQHGVAGHFDAPVEVISRQYENNGSRYWRRWHA